MSCNGVTQCWPAQGGQAIVPGSSPYMVHEKWIQARAMLIFNFNVVVDLNQPNFPGSESES